MAKGIIYVMTTVVPGLIKIGKTGTKNYEDRMYQLERNGYSNVVGLKRHYAIEVEDYDEKEILLDDIFSKSRLDNTELFALDEDLVVQLLSSFEGRQVYPVSENKEEVFEEVAERREIDKELLAKYNAAKRTNVVVDDEVLRLCAEVCEDFGEYNKFSLDVYKGKIKGHHNLYLKKGLDNKIGLIILKKDFDKFNLNTFDTNFTSFRPINKEEEYGWTGQQLIKVLNHIKEVLESEGII